MDYTTATSHYDMGQLLMQKIVQALPNIEQLADSYLTEIVGNKSTFDVLVYRMAEIRPQISQEYLDEMYGMASQVSGGDIDSLGDNKLSKNELYLMQLIPDVWRTTQCSGVSAFGSRSATSNTMTARVLDWYDGASHELAQFQSVTTIKNGDKSICMIGYLCVMGVITGFNDEGIFAGILDSHSGATYSSTGKSSYILDIRYALENYTTLTDVAGYLTNVSRNYAFNHLILLSDNNTSQVLENNFSGTGTNMHRALRSDTSSLNPGITWGINNAVAAVNSFLLLGNHDNHTGALYNTNRWSNIKTQLQNYGDTITLEELKLIASFDNGDGPGSQSNGDIYNGGTQQIVIYQPDNFHLEISFKPKSGILPTDPVFENIPVYIGSGGTEVEKENSIPPKESALGQNYPNPFNPTTNISFFVETYGHTSLRVYDILGREVETLVNSVQQPGNYSVPFDASKLASGIYFYQMRAGNFVETKKLVLMK
jgi:hypothetical protein